MSQRLSRGQREQIIIDFINGKETPGFEVKENPTNGKFTVKRIKEEQPKPKFEIEEEDVNETNVNESVEQSSDDDYESLKQPPKRKQTRSKQDARELLKQLSQLLNEGEEESQQKGQYIEKRYNPGPQSWKRKKLVL